MSDSPANLDSLTREFRGKMLAIYGLRDKRTDARIDSVLHAVDRLRDVFKLPCCESQPIEGELDWDRVKREQPQIQTLIDYAKSFKSIPGFCRGQVWKCPGGLCERLSAIVGPKSNASSSRWMKSMRAFNAAARALKQHMPYCGHDPGLGCA